VTASPTELPDARIPELVIAERDDAVVDLLRAIQRTALLHSEAAQGLFESLAEEGRLFAQTAEGKRWKSVVLHSTLLARAQLVWQNATLWLTERSEGGATPSALIDAVAAAAASPRRDLLLDRLFREMNEDAT
jgi:hypothetical protein